MCILNCRHAILSYELLIAFINLFSRYSIKLGIPLSYCGSSISCETNAPGLRVISIKPESKWQE